MNESELIILDDVPSQIYYSMIKESAMYALISLPFTVNRMYIKNIERRIENIAKGKIAEKLFKYYCDINSIPADFNSTETPFYQADKRDFILDGYEWDIKNNFLHHNGNQLEEVKYLDLPALVPYRHSKDQWSVREKTYFKKSNGVRFLFTFLKATDKNSRQQFIQICLSGEQKNFLWDLMDEYGGKTFEREPFDSDWFWDYMNKLKDDNLSLLVHDFPNLVITGYADQELFDHFKITNSVSDSNFIDYIKPQWYQLINKGNVQLLKFLNGTIWTRIPNATLPVSKLKAFSPPF